MSGGDVKLVEAPPSEGEVHPWFTASQQLGKKRMGVHVIPDHPSG